MKKMLLPLVLVAGCLSVGPQYKQTHEGDAAATRPSLYIRVHTINRYYAERKAMSDLQKAFLLFDGAVRARFAIFVDGDMPTRYVTSDHRKLRDQDKILDVYYFLSVGAETDEGLKEVSGLITHDLFDPCHTIVAINGESSRDDTLAHELGHLFGLQHVDDPYNVMDVDDRYWKATFTPEQLETIRQKSEFYRRKCRQ